MNTFYLQGPKNWGSEPIHSHYRLDQMGVHNAAFGTFAGTRVPSGELWVGRPARKVRDLTPDDLAIIERSAAKVRSSSPTFLSRRFS